MNPNVKAFFEADSCTVSYVVRESGGTHAAVIDPVLNYDLTSGRTATQSVDEIANYVREEGLRVDWILETHAHADHLSGAKALQEQVGGRLGIGEGIRWVQCKFKEIFHLDTKFHTDGEQFDRLFKDGDSFAVGDLNGTVLHTPGHTNDSVTYLIGDTVFVGDTLFMPDSGTARCDFPGGDAHALYRSIQRILALPDHTRMFVCHDYATGDRDFEYRTTIEEQRRNNIHVNKDVDESQFVAMRTARDETLAMPKLIVPAIQINIRAGNKPDPEANGVSYLKVPLDLL